jgi:hypothetical protein
MQSLRTGVRCRDCGTKWCLGGVTIATSIAFCGIDISLGGNADFMARLKLFEMLMTLFIH